MSGPTDTGIPDVHSAAADLSLRYVDLNRRVNQDYGRLGERFQAIIDPSCDSTGISEAYPGWFAFAAFASRGIGQAQLGAEIGLEAARFYRDTGSHHPRLAHLAAGLMAALIHEEARLAATFLIGFASAFRHQGALQGIALPAILEPRTFLVSTHRLLELLLEAPGSDPIDRLSSVAATLRNTMEEGNRRIYADIGGAGQDYLIFRRSLGGNVTPEQALAGFPLSERPDLAQAAYRFALQHLDETPLPVEFGDAMPDLRVDARPLVVAGLALYELAGRTTDLAAKNRCVAFANNFLIYREQQQALQPAFTPGRLIPGEVDRLKLLAIITPGIEVVLRHETWTFAAYAERHLPARSHDPLLSRSTQYNWGVFEDRWLPITDTFGPCYRNPRAMWPVPNPDPNEGI
jgi:hypothetical protein